MTVDVTAENEEYYRFLRDVRRISHPHARSAVLFAMRHICGKYSPDELTEENYQWVAREIYEQKYTGERSLTNSHYPRYTRMYCEYLEYQKKQETKNEN